jgi:hypothetical protein
VKGWTKLLLDIVMGAVVPILILNNLTKPLGAPLAYVLAALVPVSYVLIDTFVLSRRFNAITTYVASAAIMNGVLAFWFVDGWQYALKDTAGLIVAAGLFFGSLLLGRPMFEFFAAQVFQPDTAQKDRALPHLVRQADGAPELDRCDGDRRRGERRARRGELPAQLKYRARAVWHGILQRAGRPGQRHHARALPVGLAWGIRRGVLPGLSRLLPRVAK